MKIKQNNNLEDMIDDALNNEDELTNKKFGSKALLPGERKTRLERGQEISIQMGHFISGLQKRNDEDYLKQWEEIFKWFIRNPNQLHLINYYIDPDTIKDIPYESMKWSYNRFKDCGKIKELVDDLRKSRYEMNGLTNVWNSNMCKFLMINHFRDDYKSERTEESVDIKGATLKYKFDDQSLNKELNIDDEENNETDESDI